MLSRLLRQTHLAAGPLALAGYFLPWLQGQGILALESFSGFELLRLTGALRQLDLPLEQAAPLMLVRGLLLALPVAAAWLTLLAPKHRRHWGYRVGAAYLVLFTTLLTALLLVSGRGVGAGLVLLLLAGGSVLASRLGEALAQRQRTSRTSVTFLPKAGVPQSG